MKQFSVLILFSAIYIYKTNPPQPAYLNFKLWTLLLLKLFFKKQAKPPLTVYNVLIIIKKTLFIDLYLKKGNWIIFMEKP